MASASRRPPTGFPPPGPPPPPAGSGGRSAPGRRRWRIAVVAGVAGVSAGAILSALALAPSDAPGYGPELERAVEAACRRAAPDVVDPAAACRCAYRSLVETVPFERLSELDDELRRRGGPPSELTSAVRDCSSATG